MTYRELYEKAERKLEKGEITSGEFDELTKPLDEEIRPHGEWIFHKYDKDYECSNCHVRFDRTQIYTEKRFENALWAKMEIYNFCPNCGADMRKGGEDMPKSPSQECMKRGAQVREWIMQGMKEADEWIKENGKNPYADILREKEGDKE